MEHRRREPAPGIFRLVLPLPFPGLTRVNAYVLLDGDHAVLVDCGIYDPWPESSHGWSILTSALATCGVEARDVDKLVVTHPHIDHYGMAACVVRETGCDLWMHSRSEGEVQAYEDPERSVDQLKSMYADQGLSRSDIDELTAFEDWRAYLSGVVLPTRVLTDREDFIAGSRQWRVVHTPGHSPAHVCLWSEEDGLLISGDHLLGSITPHIDFRPRGDDDPLGEYLRSLKKVEQLDPSLVLPGHGRPFDEGAERARAIAGHHDRRLGAISQVIRRDPKSAASITDEIFGSTLLNFQRRLALGETLAHLVYLMRRGEIEAITSDDGTMVYKKMARRRTLPED